MRVPGEVEGRAAQVLGWGDDVPQHLTDRDNLHFCRSAPNHSTILFAETIPLQRRFSWPCPRQRALDHLQQPFASSFPIVTGEDVRADFNEAWKHFED